MKNKAPYVIHVKDMPDFPEAVYIGRAVARKRLRRSKWQNPFKIEGETSRDEALELFKIHMTVGEGRHLDLNELTGNPLACWCRSYEDEPTAANRCHGDILIELWEQHVGTKGE